MAGRKQLPQREQQAVFRALFPAELEAGRMLLGENFPLAAANLIKIAQGYTYRKLNLKGEVVEVDAPPDREACIYILNRMLGAPRLEPDAILDRLNETRADLIGAQIEFLVKAQVEELLSRTKLRTIEAEMWPKQFVTEEQQQDQLQTVASELLRKLMSLTPEEYQEINEKHKDPGAALEALKGAIGVQLSEVMEAVMGKDGDPDDEEEEVDAPEEN